MKLTQHTPPNHLYVTIEGLGTSYRIFDSNTITELAHKGLLQEFLPPKESEISELSGKEGFLYRDNDVPLRLTADEIVRLIKHELTNAEYKKLKATHGIFFQIHDDFYNE